MATLTNGTYYVFNAAAPTRCLDVTANSPTDGANVQLWDYNQTDAQVWTVTDAYNSTKRIINRLSGKSLDVDSASTEAGTNVQIWTNTDPKWQGQRLAITDAETTATINGETYDCYYLSMSNATSMVFEATGTANWSNVELASKTTSTSQYWCFVPVPAFRDGGIYEIASALNYDLRLDVAGAGKTNGTNLQLFSANQTNAQKFYVTAESAASYSLRSIVSGLYVDVDSALAEENTNVQLWDDNDTVAQRWYLYPYGDVSIDGENCNKYLLGSYVTNDGQTYYMNVQNAVKSSNANVLIHTLTSNVDAATFALIPSWEVDESLPVPYDLGCSTGILTTTVNKWAHENRKFYLTWKCASSWVSSGPNHFEIRTRTRTMSSISSTWSAWSSWSAWETANISESGNQYWDQTEYKQTYYYADIKNYELQFQVRACNASSDDPSQQTVGMAATKTIPVYKVPSITADTAEWSPDGLKLVWDSDYKYGTTEMLLNRIQYAPTGTTNWSDNALGGKTITVQGNSLNSTALIPLDQLSIWPIADGCRYNFGCRKGYDQLPASMFDSGVSSVSTVDYKSGFNLVTPTFEWHGVRLIAFVYANSYRAKVWVRFQDGTMRECRTVDDVTKPAGCLAFDVIYPFGEDFEVCAMSTNSQKTSWFTYVKQMTAVQKYFHSFTWNYVENGLTYDRTVYLECFNEGDEQFQVTKNAVYQADVLDSRPYESISSVDTVKTHLTISGVLMNDVSTNNAEDIRYMVNHHVLWRSPVQGNFADLYISDVTLIERKNRTEVTISAIKETI